MVTSIFFWVLVVVYGVGAVLANYATQAGIMREYMNDPTVKTSSQITLGIVAFIMWVISPILILYGIGLIIKQFTKWLTTKN